MENLSFVLWVFLIPVGNALTEYLRFLRKEPPRPEWVQNLGVLVSVVLYVWGAVALYRPA